MNSSILSIHGNYFVMFVLRCEHNTLPLHSRSIYSLIKEESNRPKYSKLLQHPFICRGENSRTDVATYFNDVLHAMTQHGITPFTADQPAECWFE